MSTLSKRIKELERELSQVDGSIRSLSKVVKNSGVPPGRGVTLPLIVDSGAADRLAAANSLPRTETVVKEPMRRVRDERFLDYLSSSLGGPVRPLKHERSQQRNKALVMMAFVALLIVWLIYHVVS